mmetsp:Transcript_56501/g.156229  ORF Transcript_56501/g.156229 Transcript_56501/m.156229 type:complete len:284 (+) Transcript_56501:169-1020(+)
MAKVAADLRTELGDNLTEPTQPILENGWNPPLAEGHRLPPLPTLQAPTHGPAVAWPPGTTHIVRFAPSSSATTLAVAKENTIARALLGQEGYAAWIQAKRGGLSIICHGCAVVGGWVLGSIAMALNNPGHPSILVAALVMVPSCIEYTLTKIPRAMSKMNRSFTVIFGTLNLGTWAVCMSAARSWHTADCLFFAGLTVSTYLGGFTADATGSRAEFDGEHYEQKFRPGLNLFTHICLYTHNHNSVAHLCLSLTHAYGRTGTKPYRSYTSFLCFYVGDHNFHDH